MKALRWVVDYQRGGLVRRLRDRRFGIFLELLDRLPRPVTILDVGGTGVFWKTFGFSRGDVSVTTINLEPPEPGDEEYVTALQGDARDLSRFADGSFDVVFSNSLIEHIGGLEAQTRLAGEIRRIGRDYFVQTPNRYFPVEPHFLLPFFQFMSIDTRAWLLSRFALGWHEPVRSMEEARELARSVNLLDRRTIAALFPEASIWEESLLGLTKSFVAHTGFGGRPPP